MATKAKKPIKRTTTRKSVVRKATTSRRPLIVRSDEYTQLTWILVGIWLVLIAIFLGSVVKQMG